MRKVIGIVGEGPTDYMVIKEVIDHITGEANEYRRLRQYGCMDNSGISELW